MIVNNFIQTMKFIVLILLFRCYLLGDKFSLFSPGYPGFTLRLSSNSENCLLLTPEYCD